MKNDNTGVKRDYPIESGTAGRTDGHDQTADDATEQTTSPREDAAETTKGCIGADPRPSERTDPGPENTVDSRRATNTSVVLPDGGRALHSTEEVHELRRDLTKFQNRVLEILAEDDRYGLAIKRELEDYYGEEVNHGRLYPNLDGLIDLGLVEKSELDKRTNNYELTEKAQVYLEDDLEWQDERVNENGGDGE